MSKYEGKLDALRARRTLLEQDKARVAKKIDDTERLIVAVSQKIAAEKTGEAAPK